MICSPDDVHELIQRVRHDEDTAVDVLCKCFASEISAEAYKVDYWDKEVIKQEIRNEFIFQIKNSGEQN